MQQLSVLGDLAKALAEAEKQATGQAVAPNLKFRGESVKQEVDVAMSQVQLRQWLGILRSQYVKAGWDVTSWPDWLGESSVASPRIGSVTIH